MRPSKFQVGDRVNVINYDGAKGPQNTNTMSGWVESIRWIDDDFVYSVRLDVPVENSMLHDIWVAREFEIERQLTYPRINLNGTGKEQLMEALRNAHQSVIEAIHKVTETAPHGRDYQTLPDNAYPRARADYETRMLMLDRVRDEILEIAMKIDEQGR